MAKLYKYQSINKFTISSLIYRGLWAAKPLSFNDPFEFRLKELKKNDIDKLKNLSEIRNENPHLDKLSDFEFAERYKIEIQNKINGYGVICYTETNDNILMWSHYADNHYGMCLGFEFEDLNESGIYKVNYETLYPELDFEKIWHKEGMAKIFWTKSKDWAYENEWRKITIDSNKIVPYAGRLIEVIFGYRTSEEDKILIKEILKEETIKYLNADLDQNSFKIKIKQLHQNS